MAKKRYDRYEITDFCREAIENEIMVRGWTQHTLASKSGIHVSSISRIINGKNKCISRKTLKAIADTFGTTSDWLLYGNDQPMPKIPKFSDEITSSDDYCTLSSVKSFSSSNQSSDSVTMVQCIVDLVDGRKILVQGKDVYWEWFDSEDRIRFWDEGTESPDNDDLKIAEFDKSKVVCITRREIHLPEDKIYEI
jgi:transcriptional regulator with XRE-family HTH domain